MATERPSKVMKQLDKKAKINFKIWDTTNWEKNNYNTDSARYLKKVKRESDDEIWSVNRMKHKKYFSWKVMHKM